MVATILPCCRQRVHNHCCNEAVSKHVKCPGCGFQFSVAAFLALQSGESGEKTGQVPNLVHDTLQVQRQWILSLETRPLKNQKGGSGTSAGVEVYTAPSVKAHFDWLLISILMCVYWKC